MVLCCLPLLCFWRAAIQVGLEDTFPSSLHLYITTIYYGVKRLFQLFFIFLLEFAFGDLDVAMVGYVLPLFPNDPYQTTCNDFRKDFSDPIKIPTARTQRRRSADQMPLPDQAVPCNAASETTKKIQNGSFRISSFRFGYRPHSRYSRWDSLW